MLFPWMLLFLLDPCLLFARDMLVIGDDSMGRIEPFFHCSSGGGSADLLASWGGGVGGVRTRVRVRVRVR